MYEKFQLKFLKWACGVHRKTSNIAIFGDSGRYPFTNNAIKLAIDYFYRIQNATEDTLIFKAYKEQRLLNLDWFVTVSALIEKYNIGRSTIPSINVNEKLNEHFKQNWIEGVNNSEKLSFYQSIKLAFQREEYLKVHKFLDRSNICKFRTSSHCLSIEQGRYTSPKTPRQERICIYCLFKTNNPVVENEQHVLFHCPLYHIPIKTFTESINRPIIDVFKRAQNITEMRHLGKLCTSIFDIHEAFFEYAKLPNNQEILNASRPCVIL